VVRLLGSLYVHACSCHPQAALDLRWAKEQRQQVVSSLMLQTAALLMLFL
jgi:aromatic ring-cleaving dioxygenase